MYQTPNGSSNSHAKGPTSHHISIIAGHSNQKGKNEGKSPNKREELMTFILRKLRSEKEVVRIKTLIICHSIVKATMDQEFMDTISE